VRSADEEADVRASALSNRSEQLSLQPLYARPPPIWLHPTFAAEFADPFIANTPFEESALHVSLEVRTPSLDTPHPNSDPNPNPNPDQSRNRNRHRHPSPNP
jgi:hypothetical protein